MVTHTSFPNPLNNLLITFSEYEGQAGGRVEVV